MGRDGAGQEGGPERGENQRAPAEHTARVINRRAFLKISAGALAAATAGRLLRPRAARAFGPSSKFAFALVQYDGNWNARPGALVELGFELDKRTSIDARSDEVSIRLADPALWEHPFLWLAGDRALPPFSDADLGRLQKFLSYGGFLVIDGSDDHPGGDFDASVRALVARLFPGKALARLPDDHVIYKSFYLLNTPVGRTAAAPYLESLTHDERELIVYSQNDLLGAWAKDPFLERFTYDCVPGGEEQREMAFRLGINLTMYATCLDYKTDQVHVPFILERRKWRTESP